MERTVFEPVSCHLYQLACAAYHRCTEADFSVPQQDAVTAVVLSVAALEGFINELAHYGCSRRLEWRSLGDILNEAEAVDIRRKYLLVGHIVDQPFDKGSQPYQDFALLVKLRNTLIHPKQVGDFVGEDLFKIPSPVPSVLQRAAGRKASQAPWYAQICITAVAEWACYTASKMIHAVLEKLPARGGDAFEMVYCKLPDGRDCFDPELL